MSSDEVESLSWIALDWLLVHGVTLLDSDSDELVPMVATSSLLVVVESDELDELDELDVLDESDELDELDGLLVDDLELVLASVLDASLELLDAPA